MILLPLLACVFFIGTMFYSFTQESINKEYVDHKILNITGLAIPFGLLFICGVYYVQIHCEEYEHNTPTVVMVDTQSITHQIDSLQNIINGSKK